jgi:hypothetical protein
MNASPRLSPGSPTNRRPPIVAAFDGVIDGGLVKVTSRRGWPVLEFLTVHGERIKCVLRPGQGDEPVYLQYELKQEDR